MPKSKTFYVTTPIYYPNDIPHLGHAYTTIAADVLSRWHKLNGYDVFFLTGTDEHGKKMEETAQKQQKNTKEFVDSIVPGFIDAWKKLNIQYNRFIRTTDKDHEKVVEYILEKSLKNKDIYKGNYEGLYCVGCEAYYTEKDLVEGCCPIHKKPVEKIKEESYFFKLSKYQKKLLALYKKNPQFISPKSKQKEIINRVKEGLQDLSISRTSFSWGIPLPFDKKHVCYVWFDALANYISGINYLENKKQFNKYWPADVHIVGKDILWFHAVIWPAILMSAEIDMPKKVFAHGWWTVQNEKMGKSAGNAIKVDELINYAGVDSARYFLLREASFGDDGDFSQKMLIERHNNELANKLGNLVSRVSALAEQHGMQESKKQILKISDLEEELAEKLSRLEFDKALNLLMHQVDKTNEYAQEKKPWETKDNKIIYELVCAIKDISILISPFIPETTEKISKIFNFDIDIKQVGKPLKITKIKKSPVLFSKIEFKEKEDKKENEKPNKPAKIEGIMSVSQIKYDDFAKLDLRVGNIEKAEDIEGADKLYKLQVDIGTEKRQILAGIKPYYKKEELVGKQIICIVNLEPRKMKGLESQGMLLAAGTDDKSTVVLISPEKKTKSGLKIS
ncbi:MAG TPA: methionine--tRNA ligase [Candidatus Nanoarchaeia archaeon]|nr:methionine--tRNA ligase [Candidatus Nanoarchaeia archaeon]